MTKQEKFDKYKQLIHGCVNKYFGNQKTIEYKYQSFGIEYDDLVQIGLMYLWEIIDDIDETQCPSGYIYRGVIFSIRNYMRTKGSLIKMPEKNKYECLWSSYNVPSPSGDGEMMDFIPDELTDYRQVENKVFFEQVSQELKDYEVDLLQYRLRGLTQQEIADRVGMSRQGVQLREQVIFKKIRKMVG